jgi:hypothetical protein
MNLYYRIKYAIEDWNYNRSVLWEFKIKCYANRTIIKSFDGMGIAQMRFVINLLNDRIQELSEEI